MTDLNAQEAQRRVNDACALIESAYRLAYLRPRDTINAIRSAIASGMDAAADDAREEAGSA